MKVHDTADSTISPAYRKALADLLYQLADDELCIGHRDSEWLGLAPDIEEDVAFSSIAQDEVGHSAFFYERLAELEGGDSADALAFCRKARERKNALLTEEDNGDWARTIARHFFYDTFDGVRLEALAESSYQPLARGVAKIRREEHYHHLHLHLWFTRLGTAGGEARERLNRAAQELWPRLGDLFSLGLREETLLREGIIACGSAELQRRWEERVRPAFTTAGLVWPGEIPAPAQDGRLGEHTPQLEELLATLSEVYATDPAARW
ncbi:1,2-phenylacetyl-CoA epoxidase subunit PaaC [Salinithrix halophila]|uniref:1,2-phenylacetyl-CoA epoxidase subunit PaaC n=1 Tax=Salinithrix halophila TaxID=1485204 RepID=A0ABV8JAH0_9BACL